MPGTEGPPYNSGFCVIDWDGDCQLDLLVARVEYHQGPSKPNGWDVCGRLWLYPGRSNDGHGVGDRPDDAYLLGTRPLVEVEGKPLIVNDYAAFPALGDVDGDGRPDLLLGDPRGFLKVYRNVGMLGRLRLAAPVRSVNSATTSGSRPAEAGRTSVRSWRTSMATGGSTW